MNKRIVLRALACAAALALCLSGAALAELARGSRGDVVAAIQRRLIEMGYLNDVADGVFGKNTEQAVLAFQIAMNLPKTGVVDALTQQYILEQALPGAAPGATEAIAGTPTTAPVPTSTPVPLLLSDYADVFAALKVMEGCGWIDDEESDGYGLGRNAAGQAVVYGISIVNNGAPDRMDLDGVSWAVEFDTGRTDMMACWASARAGITSAKVDRHTEISNGGVVYPVSMVDVFLPDDPAIAGEQTLTLSLSGHTAVVRVALVYDGGYGDGNGWKVNVLGVTVDGEVR